MGSSGDGELHPHYMLIARSAHMHIVIKKTPHKKKRRKGNKLLVVGRDVENTQINADLLWEHNLRQIAVADPLIPSRGGPLLQNAPLLLLRRHSGGQC